MKIFFRQDVMGGGGWGWSSAWVSWSKRQETVALTIKKVIKRQLPL